jgi:hypothetical protein
MPAILISCPEDVLRALVLSRSNPDRFRVEWRKNEGLYLVERLALNTNTIHEQGSYHGKSQGSNHRDQGRHDGQ